MHEKIDLIIRNLVAKNTDWHKENCILVSEKEHHWMLNYLQGPRNDYNCLVRGMVVSKPDGPYWCEDNELIDSFPFTRFFNHGEKEVATVDFNNADMIEKLDGCLVGVFFSNYDTTIPAWHTRKMLSLHADDMEKKITTFHGKTYKFMPLIGEYVKKLNFQSGDFDYTYVFEFIHDASFVCTKYTDRQWGLYLIGCRHLKDWHELSEKELDVVADRIGAKRPKVYDSVDDMDYIVGKMQEISLEIPDFEGFVFRDRSTGNRLKLKDPNYLLKHRMLSNTRSTNTMLQLMLKGETEEIRAYFPQAGKRMDEIRIAYENYVDFAVGRVLHWHSKNLTKKELAVEMMGFSPVRGGKKVASKEPKYICGEIMRLYDEKPDCIRELIANSLMSKAMVSSKGAMNVLEIIGLKNEVEEDVGEI